MKRLLKIAVVTAIVASLGALALIQVAAQQQPGVTATREINPATLPSSGGEITVTITIAGAYGVGSVVETLPDGFSYVAGSADIPPTVDEQMLT
ncbi:MAG: hypothetical protein OXD46_12965, partial [Chloroflexi bacterium]|nr:hypothetical protein [Chloroflexota bacterium]